MLSNADLYDIAVDYVTPKAKTWGGNDHWEMGSMLLAEIRRLRGLIEDMADFRHSKEHEKQMARLDEMWQKLEKPIGPLKPEASDD